MNGLENNSKVLIVQASANLDGSTVSALLLADGFREAGWETHIAFSFDGTMCNRFREAGHRVYVVPHRNWLRSDVHFRFARSLWEEKQASWVFDKLLNDLRPDLIYVNSSVSLAGILAARRKGIPCVWHLRELFADVGGEMKAPFGLKPFVRHVMFTCATRLVTNSTAVVQNMLGRTPDASLEVVPNAVSSNFFLNPLSVSEARACFSLPREIPIVGIPGALRPAKGHKFLFEAVRRMVDKRPDLLFAIAGDGEPAFRDELVELTKQLQIVNSVRFLGPVVEMPAFYRACDIICVPSAAESFGRTVAEAFASGTPVVATAVGGLREVVDHDESGILVEFGVPEALTKAIIRLLNDPALQMRLRRSALDKARAWYHEERYKATTIRIACEVRDQSTLRRGLKDT